MFGFQLTPSSSSANFTALKLTTAGTATASDLSNFRVVYDADNSGTFNAGDTVVSSSAQSLANPINFTITGQTGFSSARRYLVVADVAAGATVGHTFTGSIADRERCHCFSHHFLAPPPATSKPSPPPSMT